MNNPNEASERRNQRGNWRLWKYLRSSHKGRKFLEELSTTERLLIYVHLMPQQSLLVFMLTGSLISTLAWLIWKGINS